MRLVLDIAGFQATWWAAALGASAGLWEPAVLVATVVILIQLIAARMRLATFATVLIAGLLALAFETAMISAGLLSYAAHWPLPLLPPIWLVALWMVFATCIDATNHMLGKRPFLKGALLGGALAPMTYWAGTSFSAVTLADPNWLPLAITAIVWMIATPIMLATFRAVSRPTSTSSPS